MNKLKPPEIPERPIDTISEDEMRALLQACSHLRPPQSAPERPTGASLPAIAYKASPKPQAY
jgi:hypothetical protein